MRKGGLMQSAGMSVGPVQDGASGVNTRRP